MRRDGVASQTWTSGRAQVFSLKIRPRISFHWQLMGGWAEVPAQPSQGTEQGTACQVQPLCSCTPSLAGSADRCRQQSARLPGSFPQGVGPCLNTQGLLAEWERRQRCLPSEAFRHKSREGAAERLCGALWHTACLKKNSTTTGASLE